MDLRGLNAPSHAAVFPHCDVRHTDAAGFVLVSFFEVPNAFDRASLESSEPKMTGNPQTPELSPRAGRGRQ
jgi:hypothetical protein